ncbi:MAG: class I SAM-dependent methyltransferase [Leptolyngbyaceae cyanobacterium]
MNTDPTQRFSSRVADYVKYRPTYPPQLLNALQERLSSAATVADIGSGTGIFTRLLLDKGFTVFAVEPNDAMGHQAEADLSTYPHFRSVAGRAEATTLPNHSVDCITCAQAFHWFATPAAVSEFQRILRPGGFVALIWNQRRIQGSSFTEGYEALLREYAIDYPKVRHENITGDRIRQLFSGFDLSTTTYDNHQDLGWQGLKGRLESCSYCPPIDHPHYQPLFAKLQSLFADQARSGQVRMVYDVLVYGLAN